MLIKKEELKYNLSKNIIELFQDGVRYSATSIELESFVNPNIDVIKCCFDVKGLCQFPVCDIRAKEKISIVISENDLPQVILREDFPIVPHMNMHKDNTIRSMCYSDLTFNDVKHKLNAGFMLECINNWLEKTARGGLHQKNQPLEPFFPYIKDVIILNNFKSDVNRYLYFEEKKDNEGNRLLVQIEYPISNTNIKFTPLYIELSPSKLNILHEIPKTLGELINVCPKSNLENEIKQLAFSVAFAGRKQGLPLVGSILEPCKFLIVLHMPLEYKIENQIESSLDLRVFTIETNSYELLKKFGWKQAFEINKSKNTNNLFDMKEYHDFKVNLLTPQIGFCKDLAQVFNNVKGDKSLKNIDITLIGAGALGSALFENFLRAGYGKWTLIDNDIFYPHNLARHTLRNEDIGEYKVDALVKHANKIMPDFDVAPISKDFFSNDSTIAGAIAKSNLIIDASASFAVERHLAFMPCKNARKVSCFLNPSGTTTIFLMEDGNNVCRLDLLEMQYYRRLIERADIYKNHFDLPENMTYAATCRSITSLLPNDSISLSAALCSKAIKIGLEDQNVKLMIWTTQKDEIITDSVPPDSWCQIKCAYNDEWVIEISESLKLEIVKKRLLKLPKETGGVLIGSYDIYRKIVYIVSQIEAPNDSICSPTSFIRGYEGLSEKLQNVKDITKDNLYYIGEWHSHISCDTRQSGDDKILLAAILEYNNDSCRPACMLIAGDNDNINIYINE